MNYINYIRPSILLPPDSICSLLVQVKLVEAVERLLSYEREIAEFVKEKGLKVRACVSLHACVTLGWIRGLHWLTVEVSNKLTGDGRGKTKSTYATLLCFYHYKHPSHRLLSLHAFIPPLYTHDSSHWSVTFAYLAHACIRI